LLISDHSKGFACASVSPDASQTCTPVGQQDHRCPLDNAVTVVVSVAASIVPPIRIRAPVANSIAIAPPVTGSAGVGIASADSAATIAETKPVLARQPHSCLARNKRW
jgi:hypothetical protein